MQETVLEVYCKHDWQPQYIEGKESESPEFMLCGICNHKWLPEEDEPVVVIGTVKEVIRER